MLDADEVHKLQHRLNTHREHLSILLDQAASFGSAVPAHIVIDIQSTLRNYQTENYTPPTWNQRF